MKPETQSILQLGTTRSKAKMYEYSVPIEHHIEPTRDLSSIMDLTIAILGDECVSQQRDTFTETEDEARKNLLFSAHYFDSFVQAKWNQSIDHYFLLIGAAAYYLSDLPGNAWVLANRIGVIEEGFDGRGLGSFLLRLLKKQFYQDDTIVGNSVFAQSLRTINDSLIRFMTSGASETELLTELAELQKTVYDNGTPRELFLVDIVFAVTRKLINTSTRKCLANYCNLQKELWESAIQKPSFIKEFWPSQIKIGKKNIYNGQSAVIQMPTSAGKTKAIEIIIRSSFLSGKSQMGIVVAPFRALCTEIRGDLLRAFENEEVSVDNPPDTFQVDFEDVLDFNFESQKLILVLTPEKLLYMLRHAPELGSKIGFLIYDEGHQFDNGIRGITYELLLASLKDMVSPDTQIVLISAVISNAELIGNWLIGAGREIVTTTGETGTYRTVAFTSWRDTLGRLEFVDPNNPDDGDYYVPRVLEAVPLNTRPRENERFFPSRDDSNSIALYLALNISKNGSVAIFCGQKTTVNTICNLAVDIFDRGYSVLKPSSYSDSDELRKLKYLHVRHYGETYEVTKCCDMGIFTHSGSTPQGIRLSVEYAMKLNKIKVVVCTSTLAQGVNLPIKYLLITSTNQSGADIKTRDFHNLIGRAGRSGLHTEGSIIFTNSKIYDEKSWRWDRIKSLLNSNNSEPCSSTLLSVFDALKSDNEKFSIKIDPIEIVRAYVESEESINRLINRIVNQHSDKTFSLSGLSSQMNFKIRIICAIESYLMTHLEGLSLTEQDRIESLARGTLAYSLSDDEKKEQIVKLFEILSENVVRKISNPNKRKRFGKTLLGVQDLVDIESWAKENARGFRELISEEDMLFFIWPLLMEKIRNDSWKKITKPELLIDLALCWINGASYQELYNFFTDNEIKLQANTQRRRPTQDATIEICENVFGFDATLILAALYEMFPSDNSDTYKTSLDVLNNLQKRIKYGLPNSQSILYHEMGFSDRVVAQELEEAFPFQVRNRRELGANILSNQDLFARFLEKYPSYFEMVFARILAEFRQA